MAGHNDLQLTKNPRPISKLWLAHGLGTFRVGEDDITRIAAVDEPGEMAYVAWFAIWKGKKLHATANSAHVAAVFYEEGR